MQRLASSIDVAEASRARPPLSPGCVRIIARRQAASTSPSRARAASCRHRLRWRRCCRGWRPWPATERLASESALSTASVSVCFNVLACPGSRLRVHVCLGSRERYWTGCARGVSISLVAKAGPTRRVERDQRYGSGAA
jgi:hypothetical protein